jgi:cytochrome c peroxidase
LGTVVFACPVSYAQTLSPKATLGKSLFFDTTLSNPAGQSCASCHAPEAGFTFPNSHLNLSIGVAPGVIAGRFGSRAVPQASYAAFIPPGPPHLDVIVEQLVGGQFWDGRANDLTEQAMQPFLNVNEMNNVTNNIPDPGMVVQKVSQGHFAQQFRNVYGPDIFTQPTSVVYRDIADAIAEYEKSKEVSPFSSKYDAWRAGRAELTPSELNGLRVMTGTWSGRPDGAVFPRFAHCAECHVIPTVPTAPDLWTASCFQNIGVPRNPDNPFYTMTDPNSNPLGYNPLGQEFVDYGLGVTFYTRLGLPPGNVGPGSDGQGDFLGVNGTFKSPSLRNVDKRPNPGFKKAYMHNGVFKSLQQVVHFYNTRNLTTRRGEVIDFTQPHPYAGLRGRPLWDPPEYQSPDTLVNPDGILGTLPGTGSGGESSAQVGNLGITLDEESDIVAFLRTLTDGYFNPDQPGRCIWITSQPVEQRLARGGSARVTVAANLTDSVTYQWRRNGVPIPGETLAYHWIVQATPADAGSYDCILSAPCGSVTSRAAPVLVCDADFDGDGGVSFADLEAYLAAFRAGLPSADLNGDGVVNILDLARFLEAYQNGC